MLAEPFHISFVIRNFDLGHLIQCKVMLKGETKVFQILEMHDAQRMYYCQLCDYNFQLSHFIKHKKEGKKCFAYFW